MSADFCRVQLVLLRFAWKWLFKIINIAVAVWKSWPSFAAREEETIYYNVNLFHSATASLLIKFLRVGESLCV